MIQKLILLVIGIGYACIGHSQLPSSWIINPNAFNYSMTVTSYIDYDCNELSDPTNAVGAFVGNQCRGFAYTNVDAIGRKLAYVTVYSNQAVGETVEMRFFNAATNTEVITIDGFTFLSDQIIGSIATPFVSTTNHRPTGILVSNLVVQENTPVGGTIGTITGIDQDAFQTLTYSLPASSLENSNFSVSGNQLLLNTVLNFAVQNNYQISLEVNDGQGCNYIDTFQVVVDNNAFPPVAINDTVSVAEDDSIAISVLLNDSDYDNNIDTSSVQVITQPINGTVTVLNGVLTYIPNPNYFGLDSMVYSVCDLTNTGVLCDTALVYINVIAVPDPPVAVSDTVSTLEETLIAIAVLSNDTDVENDIDPASVQIISGPFNGTVTITSGVVNYTPANSFVGVDTLIYTICDLTVPSPLCDTAMVYITVIQVPDTPTDILIDTLSIYEDNEPNFLVSHIQTVDSDLPNDGFTYELVAGLNDNDQFTINNDELIINSKTIYDIKNLYRIRVRTTDQYGLSFEKPFDIQIIDIVGNSIPLPAATYISTNGDGKNDFFVVENVVIYNELSLSIFDQFGKEVFHVNSGYNNEFDGKLNGEPLPSGAYYYVFKSDKVTYKGNITIVN